MTKKIDSSSTSSSSTSSTLTSTWTSSNEYKGDIPELTSQACVAGLAALFRDASVLAVATEASSHPSGILSLYAQPYVYAGGGLGNIAECPLQTCLAGGTHRDSITFAASCVPHMCTALDLDAGDFTAMLDLTVQGATYKSLAREYVTSHKRIRELNRFLGTGWTCGEYKVPWEVFPFGLPYAVLSVTVIILAYVGTCTQQRQRQRPKQVPSGRYECVDKKSQDENSNDSQDEEKKDNHSILPLATTSPVDDPPSALSSSLTKSKTSNFLLSAWNAHDNIAQLYSQRLDTAALDGLRVGSILWVMLGHVMAIQSSSGGGYNNPKDFLPPTGLTTTWGGQLLFASRFAVDTFLILSGYLVVQVLIKIPKMSATTTTMMAEPWWYFLYNYVCTLPGLLLHRILRILPVYGMTLGFWTQVAPHLGGGPFWYQWEALLEPCRQYGWTNWLFLNNFFPWNLANTETCFYHSWYLAVDVQLFLLAPLLVGWYQQFPKGGQLATTLLLVLSIGTTIYLSYARRWSINTFDGAAVARFDVEGYAKPHVRAQAYLAGMLLAMYRLSQPTTIKSTCLNSSQRRNYGNWKPRAAMALSLLCLAAVTFGTVTGAYSRRPCRYEEWPSTSQCGSTWSRMATFWYTATSRAIWAMSISILMELCLNQQAGMVGTLLSWKLWTPLSHLTFGAYLVHPIVIFIWQLGDTQKGTFRLLTFGMNYIAVCVMSFSVALALYLSVESPCGKLTKHYLGREQYLTRPWNNKSKEGSTRREDHIQLLSSATTSNGDGYHYGSTTQDLGFTHQ